MEVLDIADLELMDVPALPPSSVPMLVLGRISDCGKVLNELPDVGPGRSGLEGHGVEYCFTVPYTLSFSSSNFCSALFSAKAPRRPR